jgi:hypothetical protein
MDDTPMRQTRYPAVSGNLERGPNPDKSTRLPALPSLASLDERRDLAAKCMGELQGLRTAISILSRTLEVAEPMKTQCLLHFEESQRLGSEALKMIISRFTERKNKSDARMFRATGQFVELQRKSQAIVRAGGTEDVICSDADIPPSHVSLLKFRQDYWTYHQGHCRDVRSMMEHEAETGRTWTEKIEQLQLMTDREVEREKLLRQMMKRNHSNYFLEADEYESAIDGYSGSADGSVALGLAKEEGNDADEGIIG